MMLSRELASKIIDLNPSGRIDPDIAQRQFEVILKGFNFLSQPGNDFLYIADEVGLGKTYIALGIASLLRYYSSDPAHHQDMILVPKTNLQFKWQKEIRQFITYNFLQQSNRVKSVIGLPVADCGVKELHHDLRYFKNDSPSYQIFRNSSFSMTRLEEQDWFLKLSERLAPEYRDQFEAGARQLKGHEVQVRHLFAYFLNCSLPEIDLLVVDEAHNFKHGIGKDVSYRNQVASRVMGVVQQDNVLFENFPELKQQIIRKAKKVLFLSATPIDRGLYEIKNQMDCFLPDHQFSKIEDSEKLNDSIQEQLHSFLIRGVMSIKLKDTESYTRNMYRHEHRQGNVQKNSQIPQKIDDDFQSMVIGLLQYKTIKELNLNHGNRFEIGMLAGFESFAESSSDKEYEQTATRGEKTSKDQHIVEKIVDSFYQTFNEYLPHPKQDNLVEILKPYLERGEKALIFVRRIASVKELEKKLLRVYERMMIEKINTLKQKDNEKIQQLVRLYQEQKDYEDLEDTLSLLADRLLKYHSKDIFSHLGPKLEEDESPYPLLVKGLIEIYESERTGEVYVTFRKLTKEHLQKKRISSVYREAALNAYLYQTKETSETEGIDPDEEDQFEERSSYFFDRFFAKKSGPGGKFRKRSYNQDWYSINYYLVYGLCSRWDRRFEVDLMNDLPTLKESEAKRAVKRFEARQERFFEALRHPHGKIASASSVLKEYETSTFLTDLLLGPCRKAFLTWIEFHWKEEDTFALWECLDMLNEVLRGVFRNGSGLLPAYLADSLDDKPFKENLLNLLEESFPLVIQEVNTILIDFEDLRHSNFPDISKIKRLLYHQSPVTGLSGHHRRDVSKTAAQFRMPGFPYLLIATDIIKEGEDLHSYCKEVFHYGIAWNPSDMEQRTGRVDRIGSFCYKNIKDKEAIEFKDKIHVFFPYLADTLEVNQVVKVFEGMNQFIETFYDFSKTSTREHHAEVNKLIERIPPQISTLLQSKYDHFSFSFPTVDQNAKQRELLLPLGLEQAVVSDKLKHLTDSILNEFEFFSKPEFKEKRFEISGTINLEGRRAPFSLRIVNYGGPGLFGFLIWSTICSKSDLNARQDLEKIEAALFEKRMDLKYHNNMLVAQKILPFDEIDVLSQLKKICMIADNLEKEFTDDKDHAMDL